MAGKNASTFSILGELGKVLDTSTTNQAKNKGPENTPVPIMADTSALASIAADMVGYTSVQNLVQQTASNWITSGDKLKGNSQMLGEGYGTAESRSTPLSEMRSYTDAFGNTQYQMVTIDSDDFEVKSKTANIDVNFSTGVNFLLDPKKIADAAADKYAQSRSDVQRIKIIGGLGMAAQAVAVGMVARRANIDGDLIAFEQEVRRDSSHLNNGQPLSDARRHAYVAQSTVMSTGFIDEATRSSVAAHLETVLAAPPIPPYNASTTLADPAYLRENLRAAAAGITNPVERGAYLAYLASPNADAFVNAAATLYNPKASKDSLVAMTNIASTRLSQAYASGSPDAQARGQGFDRLRSVSGALDGRMGWCNQANYIITRFNRIKDSPKIVSFTGLVTGSTFKDLAGVWGRYGEAGSGPTGDTATTTFLQILGSQATDDSMHRRGIQGPLQKGISNMAFYKDTFVPFADALDPTKKTIGGRLGYFLTENYDAKTKGRTAKIENLSINKFGTTANTFLISANANGLQKRMFAAYTYHPVQFVKGVFDGSFFQRYLWMRTDYGRGKQFWNGASWQRSLDLFERDGSGKYVYGWASRTSFRILNSKGFQRYLSLVRGANYIARLPVIIANKAVERLYYYSRKLLMAMMRQVGKLAAKLGISVVTKAIAAVLSGGLSLILSIPIIGDLIEKVLVKILLNLVLLIVVMCCGGLIICVSAMPALTGTSGSDPASQYTPDPEFFPYGNPTGQTLIPSITIIPASSIPTSILGSCPFSTVGLVCNQGPYGNTSHMCSGRPGSEPAVDIGLENPGVYAPEDGRILLSGDYTCNAPGGGTSIGGVVKFYGTASGMTYTFFHAFGVLQAGPTTITKGQLIGVMTQSLPGGPNGCWTGPHVHMSVKISPYQGATTENYVNALDLMKRICLPDLNCREDHSGMSCN